MIAICQQRGRGRAGGPATAYREEAPIVWSEVSLLGVSGGTWFVIVLLVAGALAAHVVLSAFVRRLARPVAAPAADTAAHRLAIAQGLRPAVRPLALLLWVLTVHAVALAVIREVDGPWAGWAASAVDWLRGLGVIAGVVWLLSRIGQVIEIRLNRAAARTASTWDDLLMPLAGRAVRRLMPLIALILAAPALAVSPDLQIVFSNGVSLVVIGGVAFVLVELLDAAEAAVLRQYPLQVTDNLEARRIHTQVVVLKKVALVVIGIFTLASALMVFEPVRQLGTSILASAGIAGIIVGLAAQRSIATLLAGLQIAITQPIRLDDVVIVEGEWGRVEDITLTYVMVRIWDLRRLVVPITYFIEQPFQNWTHRSADVLGTVFLHVDYTVPVDAVRDELGRILQASPHWDGKVNVLQVTEARERTLELRALASAADASRAWDLRCEVREKLVAFLRERYPETLPRVRVAWT
jgi:small-conductance mechanosensitive channel